MYLRASVHERVVKTKWRERKREIGRAQKSEHELHTISQKQSGNSIHWRNKRAIFINSNGIFSLFIAVFVSMCLFYHLDIIYAPNDHKIKQAEPNDANKNCAVHQFKLDNGYCNQFAHCKLVLIIFNVNMFCLCVSSAHHNFLSFSAFIYWFERWQLTPPSTGCQWIVPKKEEENAEANRLTRQKNFSTNSKLLYSFISNSLLREIFSLTFQWVRSSCSWP